MVFLCSIDISAVLHFLMINTFFVVNDLNNTPVSCQENPFRKISVESNSEGFRILQCVIIDDGDVNTQRCVQRMSSGEQNDRRKANVVTAISS